MSLSFNVFGLDLSFVSAIIWLVVITIFFGYIYNLVVRKPKLNLFKEITKIIVSFFVVFYCLSWSSGKTYLILGNDGGTAGYLKLKSNYSSDITTIQSLSSIGYLYDFWGATKPIINGVDEKDIFFSQKSFYVNYNVIPYSKIKDGKFKNDYVDISISKDIVSATAISALRDLSKKGDIIKGISIMKGYDENEIKKVLKGEISQVPGTEQDDIKSEFNSRVLIGFYKALNEQLISNNNTGYKIEGLLNNKTATKYKVINSNFENQTVSEVKAAGGGAEDNLVIVSNNGDLWKVAVKEVISVGTKVSAKLHFYVLPSPISAALFEGRQNLTNTTFTQDEQLYSSIIIKNISKNVKASIDDYKNRYENIFGGKVKQNALLFLNYISIYNGGFNINAKEREIEIEADGKKLYTEIGIYELIKKAETNGLSIKLALNNFVGLNYDKKTSVFAVLVGDESTQIQKKGIFTLGFGENSLYSQYNPDTKLFGEYEGGVVGFITSLLGLILLIVGRVYVLVILCILLL